MAQINLRALQTALDDLNVAVEALKIAGAVARATEGIVIEQTIDPATSSGVMYSEEPESEESER